MDSNNNEKQILHDLMLENQNLLKENNQLLKKMNNRSLWLFWLKTIWFMVLIGAPVALYYYVLEPYFTSLGNSVETLQDTVQSIPGIGKFID